MVSRMKTHESTDQYLLRHWKEICREVDERKKKRRQKEIKEICREVDEKQKEFGA